MTTALFLWDVPVRLRERLGERLPGLTLRFPEKTEPDDLAILAREADVMVGWRPTTELLDAAGKLKLFINPGAGVWHLIPLFRGRDVALANGHGNSEFVAQHVMAMLLALTNRIVPHHNWMAAGRWRTGDEDAKSSPLGRRTVGLLGYGAINQRVHRLVEPFGCEVRVYSRSSPGSLHNYLKSVDTLIIAVPQTDETTGMIGKVELSALGADGLIVNVARGPVIHEEALYEALRDRTVAGAALDVWYEYQPGPTSDGRHYPYHFPFHELPNVVLSPHRAASPLDDLNRWDEVVENILRVDRGEAEYLNRVDLERGY